MRSLSTEFCERLDDKARLIIGYVGFKEFLLEEGEEMPANFDVVEHTSPDYMDFPGNLACIVEDTVLNDLGEPHTIDTEMGDVVCGSRPGYDSLVLWAGDHINDILIDAQVDGEPPSGDLLEEVIKYLVVEWWLEARYPTLYRMLEGEDEGNFVLGVIQPRLIEEVSAIRSQYENTREEGDREPEPSFLVAAALRLADRVRLEAALEKEESGPRAQLNLRVTEKGRAIAERVADWYGVSQAAVVESLLRERAIQIGILPGAQGSPAPVLKPPRVKRKSRSR
jgi:hypothetical protein